MTTKKKTSKKPAQSTPEVEPATQEVANEAVQDILAQADAQIEAGSRVEEEDIIGRAPTGAATENTRTRDFIPGTRQYDPTLLPARAYDEIQGCERAVGLFNDYHYVWTTPDKFNFFKTQGYRFVNYDGGSQSGLADGGLRGTYMFERTIDNHVRNGDVFLMWTERRNYLEIQEDNDRRTKEWESLHETDMMDLGYRSGVRTFKEVDGQTIYN